MNLRTALRANPGEQSLPRRIAQMILGAALAFAGIGHLTYSRVAFQAQVPGWFPVDADLVVLVSGVVEIALGTALLLSRRKRVPVGWAAAAFFTAVFPGNIAQYLDHVDAFGLDTDAARLVRLFFQPLLVLWALWSTQAWQSVRRQRHPH